MSALKNFTPSKNTGVEKAALKTIYISTNDLDRGDLVYEGQHYEIQDDLFLSQYMTDHRVAKVVVSFQTYSNGERVAVVRLHRELAK